MTQLPADPAAVIALRALVQPMCDYLGREGLAYFQGVSDSGRGSLVAANMMLNGGHGMRVRNKMRELLGFPDEGSLPEHFYNNNWEPLIHMCLDRTAKKNCKVCDGTGMVRPLVPGEFDTPIEGCPICKSKEQTP